MDIVEMQKHVDILTAEAKVLFNRAIGCKDGVVSESANRFVDCIIGASVLQTALLQTQAMQDVNTNKVGE